MLEEANMNCSLDDCIMEIDANSAMEEPAHFLVHVTSTPPYTKSSVCYASKTALKIIVRNKGFEVKRRMSDLLASGKGNPLISSLCGDIFEQYAIESLEKGGTFKCRELVSGKKRIKPSETTLEIPSSIKKVVHKVEPKQRRNQLYVPKKMNQAAFHAWIPGIDAFQLTAGKSHDIKDDARKDLGMLRGANRLYWLLPPVYYDSFTKKSPKDIEQYAIRIPCPQ